MVGPARLKKTGGSVEDHGMADLSKVLGDVYSAARPAPPAVAPTPDEPQTDAAPGRLAPAWADESRLDEAFANWNPGPGPDAPAAERDLFRDAPSRPLDEDLAAALSEALADAPVPSAAAAPAPPAPEAAAPTPAPVPRPAQSAAWLADVVRPDERPARPEVEADPIPVESAPEPTPAIAAAAPEEAPVPSIPLPTRAWQRSDDDVLAGGPSRGSGSSRRPSFSFTLRRG